ncbi:alpha-L-arabinofuranosidase C-terminal domain-containing protein [Paenibacillus sp. 2RAB27]|uniref:alpha-L-arabinofuranosidase C-terminal domain-containing protein n=1 Tax=Paenibacillus sp. 2RAB27 TaxID=3232991 RepID=UPI003F9E37D6
MDFEEEDTNLDGVSGSWFPLHDGKHTQYALEPAARGHSGHSQKIRIWNKDRGMSGIGQHIHLEAGLHTLRLYVRATSEIHRVLVRIVDRLNGKVVSETELEITGHRWKELGGLLSVSGAISAGELQIWAVPRPANEWEDSVSTGMIWFDHISLLPDQATLTGLLKRDVFQMAKALNSGIMRLGGNYISLYHWEDFVGPTSLRPNYINEAWEQAGHVHKYFGTDEFIALCKQLGVEPQICVNMGTGTPEEAADWVEYCNGDMETTMGALRASHGFPEPYGVKYWEVGNEMYGPWQAGVCTAEHYADMYVQFARAMKAKDASILLLGCGTARDSLAPGWNQKVLARAGKEMDFFTLHIYQGQNFFPIDARTPSEARFKAITAFPEVARSLFGEVESLIRNNDELAHLKIAVTEWNTMYFPNPDLPNNHTLEAAVANACMLNEMIRQSHLVHIANFSDLVNGWVGGCIRVGDAYERMRKPGWSGNNHVIFGTATYHSLRLYANCQIDRLVEVEVDCPTYDAGASKLELSLKQLPELDVVAGISAKLDRLTLFIVNRSLRQMPVSCRLTAWEPKAEARVSVISGSDYEAFNTVFEPQALQTQVEQVQLDDAKWQTTLEPHAIYVLEVELETIE